MSHLAACHALAPLLQPLPETGCRARGSYWTQWRGPLRAVHERVALQAALPVAPPHTPGAASCTICSLLRAAPSEACTGCQPHASPAFCCSHRCEHLDHPDAGRCFQRQLQRRDTSPTAQELGTPQLDVPRLGSCCHLGRVPTGGTPQLPMSAAASGPHTLLSALCLAKRTQAALCIGQEPAEDLQLICATP